MSCLLLVNDDDDAIGDDADDECTKHFIDSNCNNTITTINCMLIIISVINSKNLQILITMITMMIDSDIINDNNDDRLL